MGAENVAAITLPYKVRKIPAVIDVRMTQHGYVNAGWVEREITIAIVGLIASSLIKATFKEDFLPVHAEHKHGSGGRSGCPAELYFHILMIAKSQV